ncbi:peptidoglycan editing factor PgeF [Paenibacillus xanthanilyticus]|uniref:Purine nucleoside phosphorylase n=1 Tax=Paenibacillus xanthanilyticus TaxID=1783531 RepID=A0ABV8KCW7_9BACL
MEPFISTTAAKSPSLFLLPSWMKADDRLTAGFSSRMGGVSASPWNELNVGLHVGDRAQDVVRNREVIAEALGWPFEAWTCAEQVHGSRVHRVTAEDRGRGRESRESAIGDADALMTNEKDILLASFYADCVPLYFWDPQREAVALAHAGWKGTVAEIAVRTTEAMTEAFGSKPAEIRAAIGPSIGGCCYEVDENVLRHVRPLLEELSALGIVEADSQERAVLPSSPGKARIDLKEINRQIMIKAGILPTHIEITQWCTGCRTDLFYSHRTEQGRTGRMASWIGLGRGAARA